MKGLGTMEARLGIAIVFVVFVGVGCGPKAPEPKVVAKPVVVVDPVKEKTVRTPDLGLQPDDQGDAAGVQTHGTQRDLAATGFTLCQATSIEAQ